MVEKVRKKEHCIVNAEFILEMFSPLLLPLSLSAVHISLMASYTQHHSSTPLVCLPRARFCSVCVQVCAKTRPRQESENMPSVCSCTHLDVWLEGGSVLFLLLPYVFGREWTAVGFTTVHAYG